MLVLVVGLVWLMFIAAGFLLLVGVGLFVLWFLVIGSCSLGVNTVSKYCFIVVMFDSFWFWSNGFLFLLLSGSGLSCLVGGFNFTSFGVRSSGDIFWFLVSGTLDVGCVFSIFWLLFGFV